MSSTPGFTRGKKNTRNQKMISRYNPLHACIRSPAGSSGFLEGAIPREGILRTILVVPGRGSIGWAARYKRWRDPPDIIFSSFRRGENLGRGEDSGLCQGGEGEMLSMLVVENREGSSNLLSGHFKRKIFLTPRNPFSPNVRALSTGLFPTGIKRLKSELVGASFSFRSLYRDHPPLPPYFSTRTFLYEKSAKLFLDRSRSSLPLDNLRSSASLLTELHISYDRNPSHLPRSRLKLNNTSPRPRPRVAPPWVDRTPSHLSRARLILNDTTPHPRPQVIPPWVDRIPSQLLRVRLILNDTTLHPRPRVLLIHSPSSLSSHLYLRPLDDLQDGDELG